MVAANGVFPEMRERRRGLRQVTEELDAAHPLFDAPEIRKRWNCDRPLFLGPTSFGRLISPPEIHFLLIRLPITTPTNPAPASASQFLFLLAQSCGLDALARSSKVPCAPWSPGTGAQSLSRPSGSTRSWVCCASYPLLPRYQSAKPDEILSPVIASTVG